MSNKTKPDVAKFSFEPDFLVIGGGSAGCVLAARLSEDPATSVLLVEAGPDVSESSMPADIRNGYPGKAYFTQSYFFRGLNARLTDAPGHEGDNRLPARYEQARVLGGGSSINGLCGNRGAPDDYDEWEAQGATGWSWNDVLPYFRKLESDADFGGEYHGGDGPIPVRRLKREDQSGFVRATVAELEAQGYPFIEDQNGPWTDGIMRVAVTLDAAGHRVSCATGYLTPEVRARTNLRILTDTTVTRLCFEGTRVVGADIEGGGGVQRISARQTVVSAGTIHTPALLMRSGIGAAEDLSKLNIDVVADIPGVGRRLREHPALGISCFVKPGARHASQCVHHTQAHFRFSSGIEDCPPSDLHVAVLARSAWHALGEQLGTYYLWINKPFSEGFVELNSPDPHDHPNVDLRLLSDPRDYLRMREAFKTVAKLALSAGLDTVRDGVFPTIFSDRVRKVSVPGRWNGIQLSILAGILDKAGPFRDLLIKTLISKIALSDLLADDDALDAYLRQAVVGVWHPCGTCRMGSDDDPSAVTDPAGRVRGVEGLRVCDASLMPSIPRANTNLPVIMVGERIADLIKRGA